MAAETGGSSGSRSSQADEGKARASQEQLLLRPPHKVFRCGKYTYPTSILFIVGQEFCERFSYYGMKAVLVLYFTQYLLMGERTSTALYHSFTMLCYFSPVLGAILADGWLGRYRTILYVSAIYAAGNIMMSLTAIPPAERTGPLIALFIIALCTGGIKPCVSAFGGDQFDPGQEKELSIFFSAFYFSINFGSLLSTFITPVLRADVHCLGSSSCYPLAFGVPAALMVASLGLFLGGRSLYRQVPPTSNTLGLFVVATVRAIKNKMGTEPKERSKEHWLHYANDKYDMSFLQDMRAVYQVLFLFLPLPFFWALFDQQGSRWTIQASKLDGYVTSSWRIKPDQMQILNPVLILLLIPLLDSVVYPAMNKLKIPNRPLQRMVAGMFFAVLAFLAAGLLEMKLRDANEAGAAAVATPQLAIFNGMPCRIDISGARETSVPVDSLQISDWLPTRAGGLNLTASGSCLAAAATLSVNVEPETAGLTAVLPKLGSDRQAAGLLAYSGRFLGDPRPASNGSRASVSVLLLDLSNGTGSSSDVVELQLISNASGGHSYHLSPHAPGPKNVTFDSLEAGNYEVYLKTAGVRVQKLTPVPTMLVGTAVILLYRSNGSMAASVLALPSVIEQQQDATVQMAMALQIPQYVLISIAEVLFSVTGLSFSYSQAPASMKSVLTAAWLVTVAFGNLIVILVAEATVLPQFAEFFLFAGLMLADTFVFAAMAAAYKYVTPASNAAAGKAEGTSGTATEDADVTQTSSQ